MRQLSICILVLMGILGFLQLRAQSDYSGQVNYKVSKAKRLRHEGKTEKVDLSYSIDLSALKLKSTQQVRITPILRSSNGEDSLVLESYWVVGSNRFKAARRAQALGKEKPYQMDRVYLLDEEKHRTIEATATVNYLPWMESAKLNVVEEFTGCAGCKDGIYAYQLISKLFTEPYQPKFIAEYISPQVEEVKQRAEKLEAFFNYKQGRYELLRNFKDNSREFDRVDRFVKEILADKNLSVSDYRIDGYASPEGNFQKNIILSKNRAHSFASYLKATYGISDSKMKIKWHGEDWDGLKDLVEASSIEYRDQILEIIETKDTDLQRDAAINNLDKGRTYNFLLGELYPKLRRNVVSVSYVVKSFDLQEAKEVYLRKPSLLSLDELFQVANSFEKGGEDFARVFRVAIGLFPDNPVANLNCGAAEFEAGRFAESLNYLMKAQDSPEALNNIACALAMQGKYDQAEEYFDRAIAAGDKQAAYNKEEARKAIQSLND